MLTANTYTQPAFLPRFIMFLSNLRVESGQCSTRIHCYSDRTSISHNRNTILGSCRYTDTYGMFQSDLDDPLQYHRYYETAISWMAADGYIDSAISAKKVDVAIILDANFKSQSDFTTSETIILK